MKIILPQNDALFRAYQVIVISSMQTLSKHLSVSWRLDPLTLRPLRAREGSPFGRLTRREEEFEAFTVTRFIISMNIKECVQMHDSGLWVVQHECAHLGNVICFSDWGHTERFYELYRLLRSGGSLGHPAAG